MNLLQRFLVILSIFMLWTFHEVWAFSRNPNLSPYYYYKVTITNTQSSYLSGFYLKKESWGIYTGGCGTRNCTSDTSCYWNGTWIYEFVYSSTSKYYLYEVYSNGRYQAMIAKSPCSSTYLVQSRQMSAGSAMGAKQDFSAAATVNWKNSGSSDFDIKVSPAPAQIQICSSGNATCTSPNPTNNPTKRPTLRPTFAPTRPTHSPTLPTKVPSHSPTTPRPTQLPTVHTTLISDTPCAALKIGGLNSIFPGSQSFAQFNVLSSSYVSDGRRMWSNGHGIKVYFSKRWFPDVGVWVISNGSVSVVQNRTQATDSAPGISTGVYGLWDHFMNNNVYQAIQSRITLRLTCLSVNTAWPTTQPTKAPVPTTNPTTRSPTLKPTPSCASLSLKRTSSSCPAAIVSRLIGVYVKQDQTFNGKIRFSGLESTQGNNIFWSDHFGTWVIDGSSSIGYSALSLNNTLTNFIPQDASWTLFEQKNTFALDCEVVFKYNCSTSKPPTLSPTPAPVTKEPTRQTSAPTTHPTRKPTTNPTHKPTHSPTPAPTSAPIDACDGLTVEGTDDRLSQRYQIARNSTIASKRYWNAVSGDAQLFFSNSPVHNSWVINSASEGTYWLSEDNPPKQPPLFGIWSKYVGTSPFLVTTSNLTLICNEFWFPTPFPTDAPSRSPSRHPTRHPTRSPSRHPTRSPSRSPTRHPTSSPTRRPTRNPTRQPTPHPTSAPTQPPTRRTCEYLFVNAPLEFYGTYTLVNSPMSPHGQWVKVDDLKKNITYLSESWVMQNANRQQGLNNSYAVSSTDWKPPDSAYWHQQYIGSDTQLHSGKEVFVEVSCSATLPPTSAPTVVPTMSPSRSECMGLLVQNKSVLLPTVKLDMNGWYRRQLYRLSGKWWWVNERNTAALKFFNGAWYIQEINSTMDTETTPNSIVTNTSSFDDRPPDAALWLYSKYPEYSVLIWIACNATFHPTMAPTRTPTKAPTPNRRPQWSFCPTMPYFAFGTNNSAIRIYWEEPIVRDDQNYTLTISQRKVGGIGASDTLESNPTLSSGASFLPGQYEIVYLAEDKLGLSSNCTVWLNILSGSPYDSYGYCIQDSFSVGVTVNMDDFGIRDEDSINYSQDNGVTVGQVYLPKLVTDKQNCFVRSHFVAEVSEKASVIATTNYLGVKGATIIWQIFILLLVVCVLCLCAQAVTRWVKEYQSRKKDEKKENLIPIVDATAEDQKAIMAGVAPERMLRKATLQNVLTGARGRDKLETGIELASTDQENTTGTDKFDISRPPASPRRPSQEAPIPAGAILEKVPETEAFWGKELDTLESKGFENRERNIELLVKYAVRKPDGSVDKEATVNKVEEQLQKTVPRQPPSLPMPKLPMRTNEEAEAEAETGGNDAVLSMLEQDWADSGMDKDDDSDVAPPMSLPPVSSPPKRVDTADADLGEDESDGEAPAYQNQKNKRQSELNL